MVLPPLLTKGEIIILILGFKNLIGSSTCMEVIILLSFGYKTRMDSSVPTDGIILLILLFCLFSVIRLARGLITQNKCTSPYTKINKSRSALHVREGASVRAVYTHMAFP